MKSNILKSVLFATLSTAMLTSCAGDDYGIPSTECVEPQVTVTKTVADIKNAATPTATQYTADDVIEAIVVSSDKGGNFYKKMYLTSLDGQIGFSLSINQTALYLDYQPGRKVYIKLKDLYVQLSHNTLAIGALFNGNVGQIPTLDYRKSVLRSCSTVSQEDIVQPMSLDQALTDANLGKLIQLQNVQFVDAAVGKTYYDKYDVLGGETNRLITNSAEETKTLIFRTGSYAQYNADVIPQNSGTITGVLTKFNNDYQFVSRYTTDINLTEARIGDLTPGEPEEPETPETPETPEAPGENAVPFFPGNNFTDFPAFLAGLDIYNGVGLKNYATQGADGTGYNGGNSLHILTPGVNGNDYVFTSLLSGTIPANATKISFYVKGNSAGKSLSLNIYKQGGSAFHPFNVGDLTSNKLITPAVVTGTNTSPQNDYMGTINTNGDWVLVTLDISSLTDLNTTQGTKFFALKIGKTAAYDLYLSNFVIE